MKILPIKLNFLKLPKRKILFAILVLVMSLVIVIWQAETKPALAAETKPVLAAETKPALAKVDYNADQKTYLDRWGFTPTQIDWLQNHNYSYNTIDQLYNKGAYDPVFGIWKTNESYALKYPGTAAAEMMKYFGQQSESPVAAGLDVAPAFERSGTSICGTFDFYCHLKVFVIGLGDAILWFFSWFVWLGGKLLDLSLWFAKETGFTNSSIVKQGWPIVRDLANMFFSLVLLIIAFATILRIETYGMKQVLWKLVVAALLINFSLVIAGVIIDGSNVLTGFFLNAASGGKEWGLSENLMNALKVTDIYNTTTSIYDATGQTAPGQNAQNSAVLRGLSDISIWALILNIFFGIIVMLVTAFVLFAAAVLFFIRLVALWILLIFAPLAWLAMILPATRSLWNKWWHEFFKWIIFAPVYAFFLYLTLAMMRPGFLFNTLKNVQAGKTAEGFFSSPMAAGQWSVNAFAQSTTLIANYIVIIIFLIAGLIFARQSGITGATAMANLGTNMRKGGMRILSRWQAGGARVPGTGWISQKTGLTDWINRQREKGSGAGYWAATALRAPGATKRFIASKTNRQVLKDAWAEIGRRADEKAFTTPAASVVGMWENIKGALKGGAELTVDKIDPKTGQKSQIGTDPLTGAAIYEQETIKTSRLQAFKNIFSDKNIYVEKAKQNLINKRMQDFSNIKDEDTLVHYYHQAKDPQDREALLRLIASMNGLNTLFRSLGKAFSPQEIKKYIQEAFRIEDAVRIASDTQSIGYANGNWGYGGMTKFDARLGKNVFTDDKEQDDINLMKFRQMEYQEAVRRQHTDSVAGFDASGRRVIHNTGKMIIGEGYSAEHADQFNRFQPRMKILLEHIIKSDESLINPEFLSTKRAKEAERAEKVAKHRPPRPEPSSGQSPERL